MVCVVAGEAAGAVVVVGTLALEAFADALVAEFAAAAVVVLAAEERAELIGARLGVAAVVVAHALHAEARAAIAGSVEGVAAVVVDQADLAADAGVAFRPGHAQLAAATVGVLLTRGKRWRCFVADRARVGSVRAGAGHKQIAR